MPLPFTLHSATPLDIPKLAQISQEAFTTDTHTRLKELIKGTNHAAEMTSVLSSWLPKANCRVMKAVTSEGETVGWACWAFVGFEHGGGGENVPNEAEQTKQQEEVKEVEVKKVEVKKEETKSLEREKELIKELGAITSGAMQEWSAKLTPPGSKCMILAAILVLPGFQGKGVGSALIRWGTSIADAEGVYCWVSSSDGGWTAFQKMGFGEVGRLELELDNFSGAVRNEEREDGRWGNYVWRYMRRDVVAQS